MQSATVNSSVRYQQGEEKDRDKYNNNQIENGLTLGLNQFR
jgi:hypothetical protein